MLEQNRSTHLVFITSLCLYLAIGYGIERHQTALLFACYFTLFGLYAIVACQGGKADERGLRYWLGAAVIFRLALLLAMPALSDDFYRFIWDGRLLASGQDPFSGVPADLMERVPKIHGLDRELYEKLNSRGTYTVYPPVAQLIFWLSAVLSPHSVMGSVIVMRIIVVAFEVATIWILLKVLAQFDRPAGTVLLYALNPLVVLELTGNLHHEGIMIFFLFLAIHLLSLKRTTTSAVAYALAISTKLIPLLFMPLLIRYLGWKKVFAYWLVTAGVTTVCFLPLLTSDFFQGMSTSLGYYFQRFEFNASLYYLIREVGYLLAGFNIIQYAGPVLASAVFLVIWSIALYRLPSHFPGIPAPRLFVEMLWCLSVYFLATTILHPWYIITLFAISLLTPYRFPLLWTGMIFLSYAGYHQDGFTENMALVVVEYVVVIGAALYETLWKNDTDRS